MPTTLQTCTSHVLLALLIWKSYHDRIYIYFIISILIEDRDIFHIREENMYSRNEWFHEINYVIVIN